MQQMRVLVDTNVILEAFRTCCWNSVSSCHAIATVDKCVEETLTGNLNTPGHIAVKAIDLRIGLTGQYTVTPKEIVTLVLKYPSCTGLDDGEQQLLAHILAKELPLPPNTWIATADKAALVAVNELGLLDSTISLERLAREANVGHAKLKMLRMQHRSEWLANFKTSIKLKSLAG